MCVQPGVSQPHPVADTFRANHSGDINMQWTTPAFTDLRFGFEITMYIANR